VEYWTSELPTRPGWYWFHGGPNWDADVQPIAVEVVWHDEEGGQLDVWHDGIAQPIEKWPGSWLGPVDVPAPPEPEESNGE
jgi:hypothetical protein